MTAVGLLELAYWEEWQQHVIDGLPNFAAQGMYVEQDSVDADELAKILSDIYSAGVVDLQGRDRDVRYGGRPFHTPVGDVTRMWVDANVEINFLRRTLGCLDHLDELDIGAGYGRLAAMLAPLVRWYSCVDAVPVSVIVCRYYTSIHAKCPIDVYDIERFNMAKICMHPNLAINIHSWNECSLSQISRWLDVLGNLGTRWLFTVSHGQNVDQTSYLTCEEHEPSFRPLLEERYKLLREESIGIGSHPHALWERR